MKEYCVKRSSQQNWEAILQAVDTRDAARKFVESKPVAKNDEITVVENVAWGKTENAVYIASDIGSRTEWATADQAVTSGSAPASLISTPEGVKSQGSAQPDIAEQLHIVIRNQERQIANLSSIGDVLSFL